MPTYEYRCDACNHHFEEIQKISEPALTKCPACGKDAVKRLIAATAFHLKGGGWYKTDYGSSSSSTPAKSGSSSSVSTSSDSSSSSSVPASESSASTSSSGTETKPASQGSSSSSGGGKD